MVVSAANSAARKRSRPSSSAARDSRVPDRAADGMSEAVEQDTRAGAGGRAAKAREELAAVPSQDLPGDLAVADDLDADADLDGDDLEAVDLEDFEDLDDDDLGDEVLVVEDLEIVDAPEVDLAEADLADDSDADADDVVPAVAGAVAQGAAAPEGKAAPGESGDDEIFVFGDDDDDLPVPR